MSNHSRPATLSQAANYRLNGLCRVGINLSNISGLSLSYKNSRHLNRMSCSCSRNRLFLPTLINNTNIKSDSTKNPLTGSVEISGQYPAVGYKCYLAVWWSGDFFPKCSDFISHVRMHYENRLPGLQKHFHRSPPWHCWHAGKSREEAWGERWSFWAYGGWLATVGFWPKASVTSTARQQLHWD